jgi:RNA polymerase sigma factor (TIGR02999 family)
MPGSEGDVTQLLKAWSDGDAGALQRLAPVVEAELRLLARVYMSGERGCYTLQPTALINEAYLRLLQWNPVEWRCRAQFYAVAAKMMRRILANYAVARRRQKRGGAPVLVSLTQAGDVPDRTEDLLALDEALVALAKLDERKAQLIELHYFGGLKAEEAAEVLDISPRTAFRELDLARAWLFRTLHGVSRQDPSQV